jgi:[calcium/calmodulin-dependent protein kinase] kinase
MTELDGTPLDAQLAHSYFCDVLAGLEYLHSQNIIHCDLKPDNLLVNAEGRVKIIDFGSSRYTETNEQYRRDSRRHEILEGTPAFMAPELCSSAYSGSEAMNSFSRDVWALGVCLYCFTTGRLPFLAENVIEMYDRIKNQEPSFDGIEDPLLESLIRGVLHKEPVRRFTIPQIKEHSWVKALLETDGWQ